MAAEESSETSPAERLFGAVQLLLPTRLLSTGMYRLTRIRSSWFKNVFIQGFMKGYGITLDNAVIAEAKKFPDFNAFFTRALKDGERPLPEAMNAFVSPVDGTVSQLGAVTDGKLIQAKGHSYSARDLLGDDALAAAFTGGTFCTIYLAPYNYHRIHMPVAGKLKRWAYIPGRLFSVNFATARTLPNLFARNERLVAVFDTELGPLAMVYVGALFVSGLETPWSGPVSPPHSRQATHQASYQTVEPAWTFARGAEAGRFNMGSTVILLAPQGALDWQSRLKPGTTVRMGEALARIPAAVGA